MDLETLFALAAAATVLEALWTVGTGLYEFVKRRKSRDKEARGRSQKDLLNK